MSHQNDESSTWKPTEDACEAGLGFAVGPCQIDRVEWIHFHRSSISCRFFQNGRQVYLAIVLLKNQVPMEKSMHYVLIDRFPIAILLLPLRLHTRLWQNCNARQQPVPTELPRSASAVFARHFGLTAPKGDIRSRQIGRVRLGICSVRLNFRRHRHS
jgi:hypothetical protein